MWFCRRDTGYKVGHDLRESGAETCLHRDWVGGWIYIYYTPGDWLRTIWVLDVLHVMLHDTESLDCRDVVELEMFWLHGCGRKSTASPR